LEKKKEIMSRVMIQFATSTSANVCGNMTMKSGKKSIDYKVSVLCWSHAKEKYSRRPDDDDDDETSAVCSNFSNVCARGRWLNIRDCISLSKVPTFGYHCISSGWFFLSHKFLLKMLLRVIVWLKSGRMKMMLMKPCEMLI
jgi:hypothetical protein